METEKIAVPTTEGLAIFAFVCYLAGMFPELWMKVKEGNCKEKS